DAAGQEPGPGVRVRSAVLAPRAARDEADRPRIFDHDGELPSRVGVRLLVVAGDGDGALGSDAVQVVEQNEVEPVLPVLPGTEVRLDAARESRQARRDLEGIDELVAPGRPGRRAGRRLEVLGAARDADYAARGARGPLRGSGGVRSRPGGQGNRTQLRGE